MSLEPVTQEILQEGAVVGALMLPAYSISRSVVRKMKFKSERAKDFVAVALAGFLFHIVAEATGVNRWYCMKNKANASCSCMRGSPDSRVCPLSLVYGEASSGVRR